MFEPQNISGTSNLLNGIMGDTPATDNILGLEPVQNWNAGSGGPTLDVSTLNPGALTNLQGILIQEETVQVALTTETADDIDPVTRESSTPVELTLEAGDRLFDAEYYAQINPDLSAAGLNTLPQLFQHFKTHGLGEERDFSLWTNLEHYAAQNPDLEAAGLTLHEQIYQHLQTFGLAEGREFSPWVDLQYYLDNNADLKAAFGEDTAKAFEHLQLFGLEEGRRFSPKFDLNYYLSHYSDLSAAFGDNKKLAFGHLQQFGVAEGRQFLPEISEATTAESTEVENSGIAEETQEGISIVFETQTTPTTSIPTTANLEEEPNTSAVLETLPDESETPASVSIEVEEETIPDTSDEVEEETIPDTFDQVEEETIPDTFDEVEEDEGNATASDDEVEAEQLSPTVTVSQTLMGLEEEPTPPLDLPENAGGANAKKNPAPKHLKLDATQEEYYKGGTVRLNGWIFDPSGANDVERVEFSLHKTGEQWEEIESWTTFNISTKDDRWAYFDYSTFGLEPGKYQIKGFAYDSEGGKSNAAVAHFSVSAENPLPLVGVIDTGFNANNIDIDYKRAALGTDFVDGDDNPLLEEGEGSEHGTHTLGIIGATQKNGVGIYGINDQAPLWLSRAIGSGKWADALIEFVDYAIASEQPTAIANLSLDLTQVESDGSIKTRYEFTPKEREALEYARQNGILVVVAAGNDGSVMSVLGQASQEFDNIITVGATNGNQRADYSSYGRRGPDIMAEGGSIASPILSTAGEDVGTMAGTSIAAAQVTGVASLVWEANPELNYRQIIEALKSTATDLNIPGEDSETGAGLVNPDAAVAKAKQMTPEAYDPEDFLTPDTWGGEGLVTPEERAVEFNYPIEYEYFTGTVAPIPAPLNGVSYRRSPEFEDRWGEGVAAVSNTLLEFDAWTWGEVGQDYWYGNDDALWYRVAGTDYWVPSVYIDGYPGSQPPLLPPEGSEAIPNPVNSTNDEWELYTVQSGDTLSEIAEARTGDPNDYLLIVNYPENNIPNPDLIYPGEQIWVPKGGSSPSTGDLTDTDNVPVTGSDPISDYQPIPNNKPAFEIGDLFEDIYSSNSWLGSPTSDIIDQGNGVIVQEFEHGYLISNGSDNNAYEYGSPEDIINNPDQRPDSSPTQDQSIVYNQLESPVRFELNTQSLWGNGQSNKLGGEFNFNKNLVDEAPINFPILGEFGKVTIGAELKAEAYLSPGTFDTSFEALFNISYPEQVQAGSLIQLDINPSFQGDALFKSQLGASLFASGKIFTQLEIDQLGEFNLELGTKVDHDTLSALLGIPGSLDLGLSTNTDKLENNHFFEGEDKAGLTFNAIDLFKLPLSESVQDVVIGNLKLDIEQNSLFDIKGFTINLDGLDNGIGDVKDFLFEENQKLLFEIPSGYTPGNTYEFNPTIKPIVELNSTFDLVGGLELGFGSLFGLLEKLILDKVPETVHVGGIPINLHDALKADFYIGGVNLNLRNALADALPKFEVKWNGEIKYSNITGSPLYKAEVFNPFDKVNSSFVSLNQAIPIAIV